MKMKRKLLAIAMIMMMGTASANPICNHIKVISENAMLMRHTGISHAELYFVMSDYIETDIVDRMVKAILHDAYQVNRIYDKASIESVSKEFGKQNYRVCMRNLGTVG